MIQKEPEELAHEGPGEGVELLARGGWLQVISEPQKNRAFLTQNVETVYRNRK